MGISGDVWLGMRSSYAPARAPKSDIFASQV
jgi:hypothetical protein